MNDKKEAIGRLESLLLFIRNPSIQGISKEQEIRKRLESMGVQTFITLLSEHLHWTLKSISALMNVGPKQIRRYLEGKDRIPPAKVDWLVISLSENRL